MVRHTEHGNDEEPQKAVEHESVHYSSEPVSENPSLQQHMADHHSESSLGEISAQFRTPPSPEFHPAADCPGKIDEGYPHEDEDAPSQESHGAADIKKCFAADIVNGKTVITGKSHPGPFLLQQLSIDFALFVIPVNASMLRLRSARHGFSTSAGISFNEFYRNDMIQIMRKKHPSPFLFPTREK
jgi:hypothetical protein